MRAKNTLKFATQDDKQEALYRLKKLYLGYCMYIHAHICVCNNN